MPQHKDDIRFRLNFKRMALKRFEDMSDERMQRTCLEHGHDIEQFRLYIKGQIAMTKWEIADLEKNAA